MFRRIALTLIFIFAALATGVPQALHEKTHEKQHEQESAALDPAAPQPRHPSTPHPEHSDQDCPICAQFHAPMVCATSSTILVDTGICLALHPIAPHLRHTQTFPLRLACRGPPVLHSC